MKKIKIQRPRLKIEGFGKVNDLEIEVDGVKLEYVYSVDFSQVAGEIPKLSIRQWDKDTDKLVNKELLLW